MAFRENPYRKGSRVDLGYERGRTKLRRWRKGEPITAAKLSAAVDAINRGNAFASAQQITPRRLDAGTTRSGAGQIVYGTIINPPPGFIPPTINFTTDPPAEWDWFHASYQDGDETVQVAVLRPQSLRPSDRSWEDENGVQSVGYKSPTLREVTFTFDESTRQEEQIVQPHFTVGARLLLAIDVEGLPSPSGAFAGKPAAVDLNVDARGWVGQLVLEDITDVPPLPVALPGFVP